MMVGRVGIEPTRCLGSRPSDSPFVHLPTMGEVRHTSPSYLFGAGLGRRVEVMVDSREVAGLKGDSPTRLLVVVNWPVRSGWVRGNLTPKARNRPNEAPWRRSGTFGRICTPDLPKFTLNGCSGRSKTELQRQTHKDESLCYRRFFVTRRRRGRGVTRGSVGRRLNKQPARQKASDSYNLT